VHLGRLLSGHHMFGGIAGIGKYGLGYVPPARSRGRSRTLG